MFENLKPKKKQKQKQSAQTPVWGERAADALARADRAIVQHPVSQKRRDAIEHRTE